MARRQRTHLPDVTIEECLEAIYSMRVEAGAVISARVAERLRVSAPTMTDTLQRVIKEGYVTLDKGKEIALTQKGRDLAESLVRRHRLSERWLTDVLGLDWSKAHLEACKLEHAISPEVESRLSEALNNPTTCPHGNPIPGVDQSVAHEITSLDRVRDGDEVTVVKVSPAAETDPRLLDYLQRSDVIPGARLKVVEVAPWTGLVTVSRDGNPIPIGMQAASQIWVRPTQYAGRTGGETSADAPAVG